MTSGEKKKRYSFLSYVLAFTLTISTWTPFVKAEETSPPSVAEPIQSYTGSLPNEVQKEAPSSRDPYPKEKEIPSLRTETAKVYENSDGTYTAEVYTEPIHFKKNGQWVDIDNTLVENSQQEFENKANQFKVKFPKKPKQNRQARLFTYEIAGHNITVELSDDDAPAAKQFKGIKDIAGTFQKERVQYKQLYPGVTFDYALDGTKVKENIILDSYEGNHRFAFHIKAQGLKAEKKSSGMIEFTDAKTGKFLFYIQRPYMYDSSKDGNVSEQVTQEVTPVDDGFILTVTADESYLTDPKRVYPVVIDPWIDVFEAQDAFVASNTSSNYGNLNYLSVGKDPTLGKTRTYLKWTLPTIPNAKVTGASVGVYQYVPNSSTPAGPSISLHQVTSVFNASTINWSTQPSFDPTPVSTKSETQVGYNYFAVSDLVKGWYDGTKPNYGVVLKTDDAQEATAAQKLFHSTEWNSADGSPYGKPKLVISYRSKKLLGITDYWTYTPDLFNGEGTAVVNVINGNMVYDIPVFSLPGRMDAFNLKMVYNSRSDFEDVYGYRWTFSAQRKLIPNSDKTIVEYIDENGTHYHFNKQQYDTGTAYSAPEGTFFALNSTADGGYTLKEPDETLYYFDSQGRNTKVVDEKGNTILYTFNGTTNQITKISERYGSETTGRDLSLAYDPTTGRLQKITDFRGTETTFTYDSLNGHYRLRTITYAANRPERKTITFEYNDQQQLISITDGNGNKGKFEYDDLNRVWKIIDPRSDTIFAELTYPSVNETIFKDANDNQTYYKSNIDQDLATVNVVEIIEDYQGANPSTTKYEWKNNEITKVIEPNKDTGDASGPTTSSDYDDKGNLTNSVAPDGESVTNHYDSKSNLTDSTTSAGLSEQNVYDSVSNLLFSTDPLGMTDYFTYDRYGNTVSSVTPSSLAVNPWHSISQNYADGNRRGTLLLSRCTD